jgi:hypothetical protein
MVKAGGFDRNEPFECATGQKMTLIEHRTRWGREVRFALVFHITADRRCHLDILRVFEYNRATTGTIVVGSVLAHHPAHGGARHGRHG